MRHSKNASELIKKWEGLKLSPYLCPANKLTIGYGHSASKSEDFQGITKEKAESLLQTDLIRVDAYLKSVLKSPTQGQFDALCSLVFNWGCGNFGKSKGLKDFKKGDIQQASLEFFSKEKGVVNIGGKFSKGLYNRRQDELSLWNDKT